MKNKILIADSTVKKYFHSKIAFEKERHILNLFAESGLTANSYHIDDRYIQLEYINGQTLSQLIDKDEHNLPAVFDKLILWIRQFNSITKNIVLDDINLKNFIYSDGKIYGIDFESWHCGDNTENYAAILAAVNTAYFKNEDIKKKLCGHIESLINSGCIETVRMQVKKINLRRRAMKKIKLADCVIMAGGKSSRMGRPKALLGYDGHTFLDHIIYNTSVFDRQYISANNNLYDQFNCKIINDKYTDIGPMGAIHAALAECANEYVFFIPCDMPFVSEESIFCLFDKMENNADAVVFVAQEKVFPTVGIYRKSILPQLEKQIESGNYKMMKLLDSIKTQYVQAPFPHQFKNINTPADYDSIK